MERVTQLFAAVVFSTMSETGLIFARIQKAKKGLSNLGILEPEHHLNFL